MFTKFFLRLTLGWFTVFLWLSDASACSCEQTSLAEHYQRASHVFRGRLIAIREESRTIELGSGDRQREVLWPYLSGTFEILEEFKGEPGGLVSLRTEAGEAMCGVSFDVALEYLFFAEADGHVSLCGGTLHSRYPHFSSTLRVVRDMSRQVLDCSPTGPPFVWCR